MFTKQNSRYVSGYAARHKKPYYPNVYCDHYMKGHLKVDYFKLIKCDHYHNTGISKLTITGYIDILQTTEAKGHLQMQSNVMF